MVKTNVFYLLLLTGLFLAFVSALDENKAKADHMTASISYNELKYQWVVAEVKDTDTGIDLTLNYKSKMYQFLSSGGFVEFDDKVIFKTGSWLTLPHSNKLEIIYDDSTNTSRLFQVELLRPEEMLLTNESMQMRLLRLQM